jgi:hypothetical protein
MTFTLGRQSHPLHLDLVEFIDPTTGESITVDSHLGIISAKPEQPSFELHLDETIANPIIRIHGKTVGGTKSNGTITLTGPGLGE